MELKQKSIHDFELGKGDSIVFQHGLAANIDQIKKLFDDVEAYKVLGIDCPGHGQSMLNNADDISFKAYAEVLMSYVESRKISTAIYGGLSMGAGIAISIALKKPDSVKALILLRPAWLEKPAPSNLQVLLDAIPFMNMANGDEAFQELESFKKINHKLPKAGQSVLGVFGAHQQKGLTDVIQEMVTDSPFINLEELQNIHCPCLIIGCEDDPLHPFSIAETLHQNIEGSILESVVSRYIDDITHKKTVRNLILNFVQKLKRI